MYMCVHLRDTERQRHIPFAPEAICCTKHICGSNMATDIDDYKLYLRRQAAAMV